MDFLKKIRSSCILNNRLISSALKDYSSFSKSKLSLTSTTTLYDNLDNNETTESNRYTISVILWIKEILWTCHQIESIPYLVFSNESIADLDEINFTNYDILRTYSDLYIYKFVSVVDKCLKLINSTMKLNIKDRNVKFFTIMDTKIPECIAQTTNEIYETQTDIRRHRNNITHSYSDFSKWTSLFEITNIAANHKNTDTQNKQFSKALRDFSYKNYRYEIFVNFHKHNTPRLFSHIKKLMEELTHYYEEERDRLAGLLESPSVK